METMVGAGTPASARGIDNDALFEAAESGKDGVFEDLSPEQLTKARTLRNEDDRSLLHVAASSGHTQVFVFPFSLLKLAEMKLLCYIVGRMNAQFVGDVKQLLRVLCYSYQVVKRLVEGISDTSGLVNVSDEEGWTPLHSAVSSGREAMVELLLDLGMYIPGSNCRIGFVVLDIGLGFGASLN